MLALDSPEDIPQGWSLEGSNVKVTTENSTDEDLPPGWIKEIRVRKSAYNKPKRDPFFIDPVSGYVFRSKKDVCRYLETGDISACAIKPQKRDIEEKSPPSSATKRQKLEHPVTKHQLIGGDGSSDEDRYPVHNSLTKSKHRKSLDFPRRSKRLAGVQPDDETAQAVDLDSTISTQSEPRKELLLTSSGTNNQLLVDSSNDSQVCDSALPTMTIEASEDSQVKIMKADNLPVLTPEANKKQEKKREKKHRSQVGNEKNSRASRKKKESNLPRKSSQQLACIEPEMRANSVSVPDGLEAEAVGVASILGKTSMSFSGIDEEDLSYDPSQARVKRITFNVEQLEILERNFKLGSHPKPERRIELARALGLHPRQVQVWFQNKRAKLKREQDHDLLQRQFEAENRKAEIGLGTPSPLHRDGVLPNNNRPFVGSKDELQKVEDSKSHDKKSEMEFIPPLGELLSDPCLEFAFKTLTGEFASDDEPISTPAADIIGDRNLTTKTIGGKAPINSKKSNTPKKLSLPHEALEFQPESIASSNINGHASKHSARVSSETEQSHLQVERVSDKPEQQSFVSFDYWSRPCFGSAFKTLAASTPVTSCWEQQVKPSQIQMDGNFQKLPDFRLPNLFQADIFSSQPPMSMNKQSFLFSGSLSFPSFDSIRSEPPPPVVKKSRGRPRKVNS